MSSFIFVCSYAFGPGGGRNIESLLRCVHLQNKFVVLITHVRLFKGYGPPMVYVTDEGLQTSSNLYDRVDRELSTVYIT